MRTTTSGTTSGLRTQAKAKNARKRKRGKSPAPHASARTSRNTGARREDRVKSKLLNTEKPRSNSRRKDGRHKNGTNLVMHSDAPDHTVINHTTGISAEATLVRLALRTRQERETSQAFENPHAPLRRIRKKSG